MVSNDTLGLAMLGMMDDPIMRKIVGTQILTDDNDNNDLLGVALLQPGLTVNPALQMGGMIVGSIGSVRK